MRLRGRRDKWDDDTDEFRVRKALERLHVLEALVVGVERRDELLRIVSEAADADAARLGASEVFGLDELQATALLDLQMRRLAQLERAKVVAERDELLNLIPEDQRPPGRHV